jgi:hypothetical protein
VITQFAGDERTELSRLSFYYTDRDGEKIEEKVQVLEI